MGWFRGRRVAWTILPARGAGDPSSNLGGPTMEHQLCLSSLITMKLKQTTTYTPRGDQLERKLTRFEKARIIGARALQIAMGAPILVDPPDNVSDPIEIALLELERGVIPLTIRRKETNRKTPSS